MAEGIFVVTASEKGGVAKTTTTLNALTALSGMGLRVLGLDCDPQGGLTFSFGVNRDNVRSSLYEVLLDEAMGGHKLKQKYGPDRRPVKLQEVIVQTWLDRDTKRFLDPTEHVDPGDPNSPTVVETLLAQGVDLIKGPELAPISRAAINADNELLAADSQNWVHSLKFALAPIWKNYDYILADTNPSAGCLTGLCLSTAPYFFVPMIPDQLSIQGMLNLLLTAESSKRVLNPGLQLVGILFTRVLGYKTHVGTMAELRGDLATELTRAYPDWEFPVFDTIIYQLKDGAEAAEARAAAIAYRADTPHAVSYWCFLTELVDKIGGRAKETLPDVLRVIEEAQMEKLRQQQERRDAHGASSED